MSPIQQMLLGAASAAAGDPLYIDQVFKTFLYSGNSTARSINNGINLSESGGLVWTKTRTDSSYKEHALADTERGVYKELQTNSNAAETSHVLRVTSFNTNGYSLGTSARYNYGYSGDTYVSWTFRKSPIFDIVKFVGTGSSQSIAHGLNSVPGLIFVKNRSSARDWYIWHRDLTSNSYYLKFEHSSGEASSDNAWNATAPTSTHFTVGTTNGTNESGDDFVAYIFGHDVQSFGANGNNSAIKCGIYTGNGSNDGTEINLGWRPQLVLHKKISGASNWHLLDTTRNIDQNSTDAFLGPNLDDAEAQVRLINLTSTGFKNDSNRDSWNEDGGKYIYMAIREEDSTVGSP